LSKMCVCLRVKYLLILSGFNETQTLCVDFQKVLEISTFMNILSMGTALDFLRRDSWTNMMKLIVIFHNFVNVPKEAYIHLICNECLSNCKHFCIVNIIMFYIYFQRESHGLRVHLLSVQKYSNDKNISFMRYVRQTDQLVMQKQPILQ